MRPPQFSRALTHAFMTTTGKARPKFKGEGALACDELYHAWDFMRRKPLDVKVHLQTALNRLVLLVRLGSTTPEFASSAAHRVACYLGLPLTLDLPKTCVIVTGLRKTATADDLIKVFQDFGKVKYCEVAEGNKGFGMVEYRSSIAVTKVMLEYNTREVVVGEVAVVVAELGAEGERKKRERAASVEESTTTGTVVTKSTSENDDANRKPPAGAVTPGYEDSRLGHGRNATGVTGISALTDGINSLGGDLEASEMSPLPNLVRVQVRKLRGTGGEASVTSFKSVTSRTGASRDSASDQSNDRSEGSILGGADRERGNQNQPPNSSISGGGLGIGDRVRPSMALAKAKRGNLSPTWPGPGERGSRALEESLKHTVRVKAVARVRGGGGVALPFPSAQTHSPSTPQHNHHQPKRSYGNSGTIEPMSMICDEWWGEDEEDGLMSV